MKFGMEYAENLILRRWEWWRIRRREMGDLESTCMRWKIGAGRPRRWELPRTFDRHNSQLHWDGSNQSAASSSIAITIPNDLLNVSFVLNSNAMPSSTTVQISPKKVIHNFTRYGESLLIFQCFAHLWLISLLHLWVFPEHATSYKFIAPFTRRKICLETLSLCPRYVHWH